MTAARLLVAFLVSLASVVVSLASMAFGGVHAAGLAGVACGTIGAGMAVVRSRDFRGRQ